MSKSTLTVPVITPEDIAPMDRAQLLRSMSVIAQAISKLVEALVKLEK